jgi:hypothetical protein
MADNNSHPTIEELLLSADGELSRRDSGRIRDHLAACWDCRAKMSDIEGTIAAVVKIHHETLDPRLPPAAGSRALLKARLAESSGVHGSAGWRFPLNFRFANYVYALAFLLIAGSAALYLHQLQRSGTGLLPNHRLTPGAIRMVSLEAICSSQHDEVVRPVSGTLQKAVFQEYGMRNARPENYEVDYLITPGLGGSDDIRNLWPEPRYDITWNSAVKDQLEDYLHRSVCDGQVDLATAQKDVASDWIAAYKRYFHRDVPL